jgi:hypothetical protein
VTRRRVLFLYNATDWAIHNVGRDWAALAEPTHTFTLQRFGAHESLDPNAFDDVIWGYSTLGYSGRMLLTGLFRRPAGVLRWRRVDPRRACAVVQDPSEVFPERPDWRSAVPRLDGLTRFGRIAVTSNEMSAALEARGLHVCQVGTLSLLPVRDPALLTEEPVRAYTRAREYPRKNLELFRAIQRGASATVERCDAWLGAAVQPLAAYSARVDRYNCYVCTSWQEGGPLPLADALRRGCVALTTRVGQTDEWVVDGENGFFCEREAEFVERLRQLQRDPALLLRMRRNALERARDTGEGRVRAQLQAFLA